ncbi:hypothetical protein GCM10018790_75180 [Kitasatospora xanthocidica]|uniref:hypothetical protein n=1 Tax=Kitasatospora xanthocidica TaxID=83382 RepID=UPI0016754F3F|nr:hypothetical protein [Kitasatospora xanthocidica]GHF86688.1 hypothetical protein GCM10018790_75180 [Kitasatospora xanthocidica]
MIPGPHRLKGGALQLGADPGQPGPFGTWTDSDDPEHEEEPEGPDPDGTELWC